MPSIHIAVREGLNELLSQKFYNALRYSPCVFNFFWKLEEQNFPQNGMPNFRKLCAKLSFAYWKILVKCLHHEQFLLNWQFSTFQPPTPSVKWVKILEWLLSFYTLSGTPLKIYHICRKQNRTRERTFSSHCWYRMRHLSYESFLIKNPCIIK